MQITRLYTSSDQTSQFQDIDLPLERLGVEQSASLGSANGMTFNETDAGHQYDWHNAPKRQLVVTLQGEIEVQLRDGSTRRFGPGSVILAEDLEGSGHATRVIGPLAWRCLYLPIHSDIPI